MTTSVSADETEALKAEITKAVEKVHEAGRTAPHTPRTHTTHTPRATPAYTRSI